MANCKICNEPSGYYPLCKKCNELKEEGKIVKCEECETWHFKNKPCICKSNSQNNKEFNNCLLCSNETNGYLFCKECYYKYKNKILLCKISNCKDIEILSEEYEGNYICRDGHRVKSKSERDIDNYLFSEGIPHAYEKAIPIDDNKEHDLHPDFYLPDFRGEKGNDIYIEHWGFDESNKIYTEQKNYKIQIYKKLKLTVICTDEKDAKDMETELERKLNKYKKNEVNY